MSQFSTFTEYIFFLNFLQALTPSRNLKTVRIVLAGASHFNLDACKEVGKICLS